MFLNCLAVGCGGFTTFSTFALESQTLLAAGGMLWAGSYMVANVICCALGLRE